MAITRIGEFMAKYESIAIPDKDVRQALVALVERFSSIKLPMSAIKIVRRRAQIRVPPTTKNRILLNENEILDKLKLITGTSLEQIL